MTGALLAHGSMLVIVAWLVVGGLGIPLPEDAALLAMGVLIDHDAVAPALGLAIALAAVLSGDALLFHIARRLGPVAYDRPVFQRLLPPARRARLEDAYRRHGGRLVFLARHVMGIRAATFALAGIHGMPLRRFVTWDALAAAISVPLVIALGYVGALHIDRVRAGIATFQHYVVLVVIVTVAGYLGLRTLRERRRQRRGS